MNDEYERLVRWVNDDLADVDDPELISELHAVRPGRSLKQAFIETFFPPDRVCEALARAADPISDLRKRLALREPLPTLEVLAVLADDSSSRGLVERSAALARGALDLYGAGAGHARALLGSTQVPGPNTDSIVNSSEPVTVAVLADGRPYLLPAASRMSTYDFRAAIGWILTDSALQAPSRPLGVLTSASRPTCHSLRARLLADPGNAKAISAIEGATFVLCLDSNSPVRSLERAACGLFGNRRNRWYGASQIIIDAQAHAGVTNGYPRRHFASQVIGFGDALVAHTRDGVGSSSGGGPHEAVRLSLSCEDDDPILLKAESEATTAFHDEYPFFTLPVGWRWFQARSLSPNSAIQYLMLLAAHDTWGGKTPPTLTLAVGKEGQPPSLDWLLAPTHGLDGLRERWLGRTCSDGALCQAFYAFAARLSDKVSASKRAPCPSLLFSQPEGGPDQRLVSIFRRVAERHDSGYAGYLFRALRLPWTMDLITSTLMLPKNVPYMGRPGTTVLSASKGGVHIIPREESIDFLYIPNPACVGDMSRFHGRLEHWLGELARVAPKTPAHRRRTDDCDSSIGP